MIRTLALLFIGLWVVTAVVAEETSIFHQKDLILMDGPYENLPIAEQVALKSSVEDGAFLEQGNTEGIHANRANHLYYLPSCEGYQHISAVDFVPFVSEEIATEAGYQRAEHCL